MLMCRHSIEKFTLGGTMHCLPQRLKSTFFELFSNLQQGVKKSGTIYKRRQKIREIQE